MIKFNNKWNVIPIELNGKRPLIKWKSYQNIKFNIKDFIYYEPCNYAVICGKISNNLVILDFDFTDKPTFERIIQDLNKYFKEVANTLICTTPHGLHIYFYIDGEVPERHTQLKSPFEEIAHIDILGEGGYALIPPSQIEEDVYMEIFGDDPITIKREYFDKLINYYTLQEEDKIFVHKKENKVEGIDLKRFRKPFRDILEGKINVESLAKKTNLNEFVYWKYIFLEGMNNEAIRKPQDLYPLLRKSQPSFDIKKCEEQIPHHVKPNMRPLTRKKIKLYFPSYEPDDVLEDWLMVANQLKDEFDLITMDDSMSLMVREGNIYTWKLNRFYDRMAELLIEVSAGKSYVHKRTAILNYIKDTTRVSRDIFCYDKDIINFKNGYFKINQNRLTTYEEDDTKIFCYEIPHEYKKGRHDCPLFKKYLREWLGDGNAITLDDMFEMIGYSMTMDTGYKKAFFIFGGGNAGKTQFQTVLEHIIGHDNRGQSSLQRMAKNEFGTDGLEFKLINMIGDMSDSSVEDVSAFKVMTGGDKYVGAEIKGGKKYQFRNITKIWYNANYIPNIINRYDKAFFLRWILIEFPNVFPDTADGTIQNLGDIICENEDEIQGIIHEAVKGVSRLRERGHFRPEIIYNTEHLWKYNSDDIYAFIHDKCIRGSGYEIEAQEFNNEINTYLYKRQKEPLSAYKLSSMLAVHGIFKLRSGSGDREYFYTGIGWKLDIKDDKIRPIFETI